MLKLMPHQMANLARLIGIPRYLMCGDPGTRKTAPVCLKMWYAWHNLHLKTWWAMPTTLLQKNYDEIFQWTDFTSDDVVLYTGSEDISKAKVVLTTFNRFQKEWNDGWNPGQIALDEPQLGFKTFGSQRVNALFAALLYHPHRHFIAQSGSLIAGRLDAAFPMISCCAPQLYTSYQNFLMEHSYENPFSGKRIWTNHDLLRKRLNPFASFEAYSDIFPGQQYVLEPIEWVEMGRVHKARYKELEEKAMIELEDRYLEAEQPGVFALRADQVLAHPNKITLDGKVYNLLGKHTPNKAEHLRIHFMDHYRKQDRFAVFCRFVPEVEWVAALAQECNLRVGTISNAVPPRMRFEYDRMFKANELDVIVATAATAGVGLNWPFLQHVIFNTVDYADDHVKQAIFRSLRGDRTNPVRVTTMAYKVALERRKLRVIEQRSMDAWKVEHKGDPIHYVFG